MTRINIVPPEQLCREHLRAEWRELSRVFVFAKVGRDHEIPDKYCLGKGHVLFFTNKLKWVQKRYELLEKEMFKRGYKTHPVFYRDCDPSLYNDWEPTKEDIALNWKRLNERYAEMLAKKGMKLTAYNAQDAKVKAVTSARKKDKEKVKDVEN